MKISRRHNGINPFFSSPDGPCLDYAVEEFRDRVSALNRKVLLIANEMQISEA